MNIETLRAEPSAIRLLERIDGASGGAVTAAAVTVAILK